MERALANNGSRATYLRAYDVRPTRAVSAAQWGGSVGVGGVKKGEQWSVFTVIIKCEISCTHPIVTIKDGCHRLIGSGGCSVARGRWFLYNKYIYI